MRLAVYGGTTTIGLRAKDGCVTNNRGMILGYLTETARGRLPGISGELEPDATGSALNALDGQDTHICTLHLDGCRLAIIRRFYFV